MKLLYLLILFVHSSFSLQSDPTTQTIRYSKLININKPSTDGNSYSYIVIDALTGIVIMAVNENERTFPSSMTKVMTMYLLFSKIEDGYVKLEDTFHVSGKAASKQGSKMFIKSGDMVAVHDLLRGVAICSGNDSSIAIAEGVSGSEEAFAEEMNYIAKRLGMENTSFKNASGWPDQDHYTTVYDLALLAINLVKNFGKHYQIFSEKSFTYNNITQYNYNKLINHGVGVDGIKTGHTDSGGYGIIASAKNSAGRRIIAVINGCESESIRNKETKQLLKMGLQNFDNYLILKNGSESAKIKVWLGSTDYVTASPDRDIIMTLERKTLRDLAIKIVFNEPIKAPIKKGDLIAKLVIKNPNVESTVEESSAIEFPLYASEDVADVSLLTKFKRTVEFLIFGA